MKERKKEISERKKERQKERKCSLVWIYGISTFVGYLMPNPFL